MDRGRRNREFKKQTNELGKSSLCQERERKTEKRREWKI